jgi:hypothetical protein
MRIGKSISKSIDEMEMNDPESAMLHACNAIDGTAKRLHPNLGNSSRFTRLLRENYAILGPMGMPGIDLVETRFPVHVASPKAPGGKPDIADVVYGIHRCSHGHGDELPEGFDLLPDAFGPARLTRVEVEKGTIRLSDRMIFALIAVAVLSPVNADQNIGLGYFLTFGAEKLVINDWWGRASDFVALTATEPMPSVKLDFGNWMA